jgi:predicted enzyme related to lactoylglutathione lyase
MTLAVAHVVFDSEDPTRLAGFWSAVLDRPVADGASPYFALVPPGEAAGPALMFLKVPEAKQVKNRVHVDLTAPDWRDEVERVLALGATKVAEFDEYGTQWATLRDPEGNEFDVGAAHP